MANVDLTLHSSISLRHSRHPDAVKLLEHRDRARRLCVLALTRMYGRVIESLSYSQLAPFITEHNTLGFVDRDYGTAWDSTVLVPRDVLAVGLGQYADDHVEAPPQWQRVRLGLKEPKDWDPDLRSEHRYEPRYWQRPVLRAVGLKNSHNIRQLPRRTLCELILGNRSGKPIPPWITREVELTTTDWLPLSQSQRIQLDFLLGKYQWAQIHSLRERSQWQEHVSEYLAANRDLAQDSEQVIEGLLSHLMVRVGGSRQDIINALPPQFFDPVDVDATEEETSLERRFCDILYPQGPIYLEIPAADGRDEDSEYESRRAFYRRRGLTPPPY